MSGLDVQLATLEAASPVGQTDDEIGMSLWHRLLDAEGALARAARELAQAKTALDAHCAIVRGSSRTVPAPIPAPEKREHHPSFATPERKRFFARLGEIAARQRFDKRTAYEMAETAQRRIRPSAMDSAQRDEYLAWLQTDAARVAYKGFLSELGIEPSGRAA